MAKVESKGGRHFKKTMTGKALEANKINALKATGPKTKRDVKKIQPNMKHGILAKISVIPGVESQEEWDKFVVDLKMNLKPEGELENILVESLANYYWKKLRLIKYENNKINNEVEKIYDKSNKIIQSFAEMLFKDPSDYIDPEQSRLDALKEDVIDLENAQKAFLNFSDWPDDKDMEGNDAGLIVSCVLETLYTNMKNNGEEIPGTPYELFDVESVIEDFWNTEKSATPSQIIEIMTKIGEKYNFNPAQLETITRMFVVENLKMLKKQVKSIEQGMDYYVKDKLYDETVTEKIMKLDSQLNKAILQTLHELQRLLAMRVGIAGPPSAVDVTGMET